MMQFMPGDLLFDNQNDEFVLVLGHRCHPPGHDFDATLMWLGDFSTRTWRLDETCDVRFKFVSGAL